MSVNYLIAFGRKPLPTFLDGVRELSAGEGVEIKGAILTTGPGCYNLAIQLEGENEEYVNALTMALMPAKWSVTLDHIEPGVFENRLVG